MTRDSKFDVWVLKGATQLNEFGNDVEIMRSTAHIKVHTLFIDLPQVFGIKPTTEIKKNLR